MGKKYRYLNVKKYMKIGLYKSEQSGPGKKLVFCWVGQEIWIRKCLDIYENIFRQICTKQKGDVLLSYAERWARNINL